MKLQNALQKVEEVIDEINYSNRDISTLRAIKSEVYTQIGGKTSAQLETDMGPRLRTKSTSTNSAVATIDRDGYVHGHSLGNATVTLTAADLSVTVDAHVTNPIRDTSSLPAQDRVIDEVTIINPRATLEVDDEWALYAVGTSSTLSPKYDVGYYNPIRWTSSNPEIAGVVYGTLMAHKEGTCTITASDLNNNASDSFTLTVTAKYVPAASDEETYIPVIDNTGQTDVTVAIATALSYAASNNYKKISFPKGTYKINGDNRPNAAAIPFPSNMIIDFNNSDIRFDSTASITTSGYTMFSISDKENIWLRNANFYGENAELVTLIRKESDRTLQISRASKNIHIENCSFNWSPGFNVGISYSRDHIYGFQPNAKTAGSVEQGGLGANGEDVTAPTGTWRTVGYKRCGCTSGGWVIGNFQGYQVAHLRSRLYDICFYDSNKNFLFRKRNGYTYQRYEFPEGVTPYYCRISFFQTDEPTTYEGDWSSFTMIADVYSPKDIYFRNCTFKNAISTGLSPQGGTHVVVDNCTFIDNGYQDPYSHIDWEDGRQNAQGCIVKNSMFRREGLGATYNCQLINGYCRNVTFHDNYVYRGMFRTNDESTMARTFNNIFKGGSVTVTGKMDGVFAGNICYFTPTINDPTIVDCTTHTINVDNQIIS